MPEPREAAARNWVFTWHVANAEVLLSKDTLDERRLWLEEEMDKWNVTFAFAGWEQAPTTGGWHWQGFACFEKKIRLTALKKICQKAHTIHWEKAVSDWEVNHEYCTKNNAADGYHYWQNGDLPEHKNNGHREKKRWDDAWDKSKRGDFEEIPADIRLKFYNGIKAIHRDHQKRPENLTDYNAEWIWGTTGSGKSTLARTENPDAYPKEANKWWCGYQNEDVALVEDLDPDVCKYLARYIKIWADKFPFVSEIKQSSAYIRPKKIVFTSQYQIEECFNAKDAAAIRRRCKVRHVENFVEVTDEVPVTPPAGTVFTFTPAQPPESVDSQAQTQLVYRQNMDDIRRGFESESPEAKRVEMIDLTDA